jgi:hypothetical protein
MWIEYIMLMWCGGEKARNYGFQVETKFAERRRLIVIYSLLSANH